MANTIVNNTNTTAVQVALRIRPLTQQDKSLPRFSQSTDSDILKAYENSVIIAPHQKSFQFDHVFDSSSTQEQVFNTVASNFVDRFVDGYNVTILAYGQTSSGKTYTMGTAIDNQSGVNSEQEGIIPRAMLALFAKIQGNQGNTSQKAGFQKRSAAQQYGLRSPTKTFSSNLKLRPASILPPPRRGSNPTPPISTDEKSTRYTVLVSFIEIYNEELIDLLNPAPPYERTPVTIREDTKGHIIWTGLKEVAVSNADDVLKYLQMGTENRATGSTDMNAKSSRSHAIFSVTLKQEKWVSTNSKRDSPTKTTQHMSQRHSSISLKGSTGLTEKQPKIDDSDDQGEWMIVHSKFHFVDLAGSERLKRTAAEGDRRKEGININAGLLALGNVISALSDPSKKPTHIPYRDSKLTRLLQDSLGGNSATLMIACVSSAEINLTETVNTIKYAYRARNIRNKTERNEAEEWMTNENTDYLRQIISKLKTEIKTLKNNHRNTPSPLSSSTSVSPTRTAHFPNHNALTSPSSSVIDTDNRLSTYPSTSATTNVTIPDCTASNEYFDSTYQGDGTLIVADLRRQIEELQNEVTVTRERNMLVESELRKQSETLDSAEFEHLVEPVIKEYETSISKLESQLALARAALTHSDLALTEQQAKITEYELLQASEIQSLNELKDKLSTALQREKTSEKYCLELEAHLEKLLSNEQRDQHIMAELREKIIKFKETESQTENYIHDLENSLSEAEREREHLKEINQTDPSLSPQHKELLEAQLEEANLKCKNLEEQISQYVSDQRNMLQTDKVESEKLSELMGSLAAKQTKIDFVHSQLQDIDLLKKELCDLRQVHAQEISVLEKGLCQLRQECTDYKSELLKEQEHSQTLKDTIQELSQKSDIHSADIEKRQEEYRQLEQKMQEQKRNSHNTLKQRVEELEQLNLDVQALQSIEEKQDAIIQGLESKLEQMDHLVDSLRVELEKSNTSVERLQSENAEKSKIATDMQQQLDVMLKDVCGMGMEKNQLKSVMCFMEGTLKLQEEKSEESMRKLEEIRKQYEAREEEIEEKRRTLSMLSIEKEALAQNLEKATHRASRGDEMMKELMSDLENTKLKLDEQTKVNSLLQERLMQRDVELQHIQALQDRICELEQEMESYKLLETKSHSSKNKTTEDMAASSEGPKKLGSSNISKYNNSDENKQLEYISEGIHKPTEKERAIWEKQLKQLREELRLSSEENKQKQSTIDTLDLSLNETRKQLSRCLENQKIKENQNGHQAQVESLEINKPNTKKDPPLMNDVQEELNQKIAQLKEDNIQLVKLNDSLESQLVLQRSQFTLETKNLELELMKLTAANDRLEKEVEQNVPKSNASNGCLTPRNRESAQFSSPPQTPRVSSPPPSTGNINNTSYKLPRDVSALSIAKMSKSGSYRSVANVLADNGGDDEPRAISNNSCRSEVVSPHLASSLRGNRSAISSNNLPPPTAPPTNPLPPVPTPLPQVPVSSFSSPLFSVSRPNDPISPLIKPRSMTESTTSLNRRMSIASSIFGESSSIVDSSSFSVKQYDKLVESLERKVQSKENDVKAHQEVISKLEAQLNRSEMSVKDLKKQHDSLYHEKQVCDIEIQSLHMEIKQIQLEKKALSDQSHKGRIQLEQELQDTRRKKEAAEKARKILEDRLRVLMNRKSKFMCF